MELSERVLRRFLAKSNKLMKQTEPLLEKARSRLLALKSLIGEVKEDSEDDRRDILAIVAEVNTALHGAFVRVRKFEMDFKSHDAVQDDYEHLGSRLHQAEKSIQSAANFVLDHKKHLEASEENFGGEGDHLRNFSSHAWTLADTAYRDMKSANTMAENLHLKTAP
jgi:hypothetical protein